MKRNRGVYRSPIPYDVSLLYQETPLASDRAIPHLSPFHHPPLPTPYSPIPPFRFFHPTSSRGVQHGQCILKRVNIATLGVKGTGVKWDESLFQRRMVGKKMV